MTFNELTSLRVQARFRNRTLPISPTTVHYKLLNLTRNQTVIDWTEVTPSADVSIEIDAQLLTVSGRREEIYEITIASDKDTADQVTQERTWKVTNRRAFG